MTSFLLFIIIRSKQSGTFLHFQGSLLHKQNHFLPGTQIPIVGPEQLDVTRPDYLLILVWNLRNEVIDQMKHLRDWGGQFLVLIPEVEVIA